MTGKHTFVGFLRWLQWLAALSTFLVGVRLLAAVGSEPGSGIWHVRLRLTPDTVEVLGAVRTAGVLKEVSVGRGELEFELLREDGTTVSRTVFADPLVQRWEYEEAPGIGTLESLMLDRPSAEFEIRLRDDPASRRLAIYRNRPSRSEAASWRVTDERTKLGEISLPGRDSETKQSNESRGRSALMSTPPSDLLTFTLLTNGPSSRRLNVVFLAEGYRTNQLTAFTNQAKAVLNQFLASPPFSAYRRHVNAVAVFVSSRESGSDHPDRGVLRDTYFQTSYDTPGIAYLLTIRGEGIANALSVVRSVEPEYDVIVMVVNDAEYGGSGGSILVTSAHSNSPRIAIHELGHTLGGLADEYETPFPGYPIYDEPNTTQETDRNKIKWRSWILNSTPVPTPAVPANRSLVGLFEGARYQSKGWYRPKQNCLMRTLTEQYCEVCREVMTLKIYQLIRPVDSIAPVTNTTVIAPSVGTTRFSVDAIEPTLGALTYEWRINNGPVLAGSFSVLDLTSADLIAGTNIVSVRVSDPTTWVRTDPKGLLMQDVQWSVARIVAVPQLRVTMAEDGVLVLSWPAAVGAFVLETTVRLANPEWDDVSTTPVLEGELRVFRVPVAGSAAFYRLRNR